MAKFLITGNFNRLPIDDTFSQLDIMNFVNFNTRENIQLDLIQTNISEYQSAVELSPICNNDHCTILLKSNGATKTPKYIIRNNR